MNAGEFMKAQRHICSEYLGCFSCRIAAACSSCNTGRTCTYEDRELAFAQATQWLADHSESVEQPKLDAEELTIIKRALSREGGQPDVRMHSSY